MRIIVKTNGSVIYEYVNGSVAVVHKDVEELERKVNTYWTRKCENFNIKG